MTGEIVLFWNERGSVQPHREDMIGVWVHRLPEHTPCVHPQFLTEVEASALNCGYNVQVEGEC